MNLTCPDCGYESDVTERKRKFECPECGFSNSVQYVKKLMSEDEVAARPAEPVTSEPAEPPEPAEPVEPDAPGLKLEANPEFGGDAEPFIPSLKPVSKSHKKELKDAEVVNKTKLQKKVRVSRQQFRDFCIDKINERIARVDTNRYIALEEDEYFWFDDLYDFLLSTHPEYLANWDTMLASFFRWNFYLATATLAIMKIYKYKLNRKPSEKSLREFLDMHKITDDPEKWVQTLKQVEALGYGDFLKDYMANGTAPTTQPPPKTSKNPKLTKKDEKKLKDEIEPWERM